MKNYDESYDTAILEDWWYQGGVDGNCLLAKTMREPGVEPGYLAVPDPKSRLAPSSEPSSPRGEGQGAAQRRTTPGAADKSTTKTTTRFGVVRQRNAE